MDYNNSKRRVEALRKILGEHEVGCYVCRLKANVQYFLSNSKVSEGFILLIPLNNSSILFVPEMDLSRVKDELRTVEPEVLKPGEDATVKLSAKLKELGVSKVGFDALSFKDFQSLEGKFKVEYLHDLPFRLRRIKDEYEIRMIRKAAELTDRGLQAASDCLKVGVSETRVAAEAEYAMRRAGSEGVSFNTIVASGFRSGYPHGEAAARKIREGEPVVVDIGAKFEGYNADVTRTFFIGKPSSRYKEVYSAVYETQMKALDSIREGLEGCEADGLAREIIQKKGYGEYFTHSLGHGVGLEVHEPPSLSKQSHDKLERMNVITVEPGIYLSGKFGVRIEDTVLVTDTGVKPLSKFSKTVY